MFHFDAQRLKLGPESQRRSMQTKRNSRCSTYAKVFEPNRRSFGPIDEENGTGAWVTNHRCSGTLQQYSDTRIRCEWSPWGQGPLSKRRAHPSSAEMLLKTQVAVNPLSIHWTVALWCSSTGTEHAINFIQKAYILRMEQLCRVTRWSEIRKLESFFVGRLAIIWHIVRTTTSYRKYTSMRDDLKAKPKSVIGHITTCDPVFHASMTPHNSRFGTEESIHLLVQDGSTFWVVKFRVVDQYDTWLPTVCTQSVSKCVRSSKLKFTHRAICCAHGSAHFITQYIVWKKRWTF